VMIKNRLNMRFAMETRVELIDEELVTILKKAGCVRMHFGIESGDEKMQKSFEKNLDLDIVKKSVEISDKHKIAVLGYFTYGHPEETEESLIKTLNFAKSLPLTYAIFMKIVPYMGTELYNRYVAKNGSYWEDYLDGKNEGKIGFVGHNLSHELLDSFVDNSYHEFYSRPSQIIKIAKHMKSFKQFVGFSKAGLQIIFN